MKYTRLLNTSSSVVMIAILQMTSLKCVSKQNNQKYLKKVFVSIIIVGHKI